MIKHCICFSLLLIIMLNTSVAQNNQDLSEGAKVLFKGVTTKLTIAEKNQIYKSTSFELNSDKKTFSTLGITSMGAITATVYPVSLKKDEEEQIFVYETSTHNNIEFAYTTLYIKNEKGQYKTVLHERCDVPIVLSTSTSNYPDLVLSLVAINGTINRALFRWDGKSDYKRTKEDYISTDGGEYVEVLSKAYVSEISSNLSSNNQVTAQSKSSPVSSSIRNNNLPVNELANTQQLKPGDVSPNVKVLDIDEFGSFKEGFCIVRKGTQCAIIDTNGNYVLPFNNKFFPPLNINTEGSQTTGNYYGGFSEGLCVVKDTQSGLLGYINKKMQLVIACKYTLAELFKNGYAQIQSKDEKHPTGYIDKTGTLVPLINYSPYRSNLGFVPFLKYINGKDLFGYCDFFGRVIISPTYEQVHSFSEGMAAVMKSDEYGKPKWGYINTKGVTVIDFKYSNEPGDFHNGLAYVIPTDKKEFEFAYINKQGDIKIKIDNSYLVNNKGVGSLLAPDYRHAFSKEYFGDFREGLALIHYYTTDQSYILIDTNGTAFNFPEFTEPIYDFWDDKTYPVGSNKSANCIIQDPFFVNGLALYEIRNHLYGVLNKNSEIVLPPVFEVLQLPSAGSKLYRAIYRTWDKNTRTFGKIKDGYINDKGVFVIIKGEPSKW